jgi:hypothetical protein
MSSILPTLKPRPSGERPSTDAVVHGIQIAVVKLPGVRHGLIVLSSLVLTSTLR